MGKESIVRIVEEVGKCGDEAQVGSRDQEIIGEGELVEVGIALERGKGIGRWHV